MHLMKLFLRGEHKGFIWEVDYRRPFGYAIVEVRAAGRRRTNHHDMFPTLEAMLADVRRLVEDMTYGLAPPGRTNHPAPSNPKGT